MDGARQEVELVSGRNILPKLVLKEKKFNRLRAINISNMTEIELYNKLQNVEGRLKMMDSQISELRKKQNGIMNDFLSLLPFQEGDKVKDKNGNIFIIERLKDAILLGKNKIKVHFLIRKIKKNGEPYQYANEAWRIDYFSLKKVVE